MKTLDLKIKRDKSASIAFKVKSLCGILFDAVETFMKNVKGTLASRFNESKTDAESEYLAKNIERTVPDLEVEVEAMKVDRLQTIKRRKMMTSMLAPYKKKSKEA